MDIVTVDHAGRVVIPLSVREQLGLSTESQLNMEVQDGRLILEPLSPNQHQTAVPKVYRKGTALVVESQPIGNLEAAVDAMREERIDQCWAGDEGSI